MCTWIVMLCSVTQSWLTLYNPMHSSPLGSSVHRIFQARILEWVVISCSRTVVLWRNIYSSAIRYTRWSQYKNLYNFLGTICLHLREAQLILVTDNVTFRLVRGQLVRDFQIEAVCCWSVAILWDSMWPQDCSMPGFPIHHHHHRVVPLAICLVYKLHAFLFSLLYPDYLTSCLHIQHLELAFCLFNFRVPQMLIKKHFFWLTFCLFHVSPHNSLPKIYKKISEMKN